MAAATPVTEREFQKKRCCIKLRFQNLQVGLRSMLLFTYQVSVIINIGAQAQVSLNFLDELR